jgi:hypothetical protein
MSFDFDAAVQAPFRMQPGLRRLAPGRRQLTVSPRDGQHLREKLAVLGSHAELALLQAPGFDARPALSALAAQASAEHPTAFAWDGEVATSQLLGWQVRAGGVFEVSGGPQPLPGVGECLRNLSPPWRLAGLLCLAFAEDFAVIDGPSAHIPWLAVALPSHWAPSDKVGRHFAQVHAPVADNQQLLAAGEALARLVTAETRWERFVWSIGTSPLLNLHPSLPKQPWRAGEVGAQACWRTEHQTFIPLPEYRQAVFTILVDTQPLRDALDNADKARRLHDAVASMSADVLRYRGLHEVREELLSWLAQRAMA